MIEQVIILQVIDSQLRRHQTFQLGIHQTDNKFRPYDFASALQ
jgi:hypothetical protein